MLTVIQILYSTIDCFKNQEKDRANDLTEAANFSEEICNDLVGITAAQDTPGSNEICISFSIQYGSIYCYKILNREFKDSNN